MIITMKTEAGELILSELRRIRLSKGLDEISISPDSMLLGDELGIDSLDLAMLIVFLEETTNVRPFECGFTMFKTVGELTKLFNGEPL